MKTKRRVVTSRYYRIEHCHLDPGHGEPAHDLKRGIAICRVCKWKGKLKHLGNRSEPPPPEEYPTDMLSTRLDTIKPSQCDDDHHSRSTTGCSGRLLGGGTSVIR